MNSATRLRILCITTALAYIIECGLIVYHNRSPEVYLTLSFALLICAGPLLGVALLFRPARLLFPITLPVYFYLAFVPILNERIEYPIALIPGLLGFGTSVVILVFLFTSPTKQLFIPRDPDAPVE
jgi:hypothetical protein